MNLSMVILLKMKILYYDTLVLVRCPHVIVVQTRTTRVRFLYFLFSFFFILGQHMLFALEAVLFVHSLTLSLSLSSSLSLSLSLFSSLSLYSSLVYNIGFFVTLGMADFLDDKSVVFG